MNEQETPQEYFEALKARKNKTELLQVRVSENLKEDLKNFSDDNDISVSDAVRYFIKTGLKKYNN